MGPESMPLDIAAQQCQIEEIRICEYLSRDPEVVILTFL